MLVKKIVAFCSDTVSQSSGGARSSRSPAAFRGASIPGIYSIPPDVTEMTSHLVWALMIIASIYTIRAHYSVTLHSSISKVIIIFIIQLANITFLFALL